MRIVLGVPFIALMLLLGACATTSGGAQSNSKIITQEEIDASGLTFSNAYEIVRQFRPQWLRKRGQATLSPVNSDGDDFLDYVAVYVDNILAGDPDALQSVSVLSVLEIEHYNTAQAQRLGSRSHPHGAIVVRTRSR